MDNIRLRLLISTCVLALTPLYAFASSGKSIFLDNKCATCHSVESQGIQRTGSGTIGGIIPPDLSTVGTKHSASWMQSWLLKEEEINGKKHLKKFGGSDDDLKTLTNWLASLRSTAKPKAEATPKPKPAPPKPDTVAEKPIAANISSVDTVAKHNTPTIDLSGIKPDTGIESLADLDIVFYFEKYDLTDQAKIGLGHVIAILKQHPKLQIKVYGYSEPLESNGKVKDLAKKRASGVKKYLVAHGIAAKRLKVLSAVAFELPNGKPGEMTVQRRVKFLVVE